MSKKNNQFHLLKIIFVYLLLLSCQKNEIQQDPAALSASQLLSNRKAIATWIDKHQYVNAVHVKNVSAMEKNLEYEKLTIEKRNNGEDLIIIPIKTEMNEKLKLSAEYSLNLLTVRSKAGKLRWSMIVCFLPDNGKRNAVLKENTIQKLINDEPVAENGLFKFYDLKGNFLYQLVYKDKKLISSAYRYAKAPDGKRSIQENGGSRCIDWYLTTTYYENDVIVQVTNEYLFTTCEAGEQDPDIGDGQGGGGGDGSGGGDGTTPEEPIDTERTVTVGVSLPHSSLQGEDFKNPSHTDIEYDDENNPIVPQPEPNAIVVNYYVTVTYKTVSRQIKSANAMALTVNDPTVTYENPYAGTIRRNVSFSNTFQDVSSLLTTSVTATWSGTLKYKWTYVTAGGTPKTMDFPYAVTKTFTIPI